MDLKKQKCIQTKFTGENEELQKKAWALEKKGECLEHCFSEVSGIEKPKSLVEGIKHGIAAVVSKHYFHIGEKTWKCYK